MFINSPYNTIGLDISDSTIKAVQLKKRRGYPHIKTAVTVDLPAGLIVDGDIIDINKVAGFFAEELKSQNIKFDTKNVVASLPEAKTFLKLVKFSRKHAPKKDEKVNKKTEDREKKIIEKKLTSELPKHIPASLDEMIIDWERIYEHPKRISVLVAAVEKKVAEDYALLCQKMGFKVTAFEPEAQAIERCINKINLHTHKSKKINYNIPTHLTLDLGAHRTSIALSSGNNIKFTSSHSELSGDALTKVISESKKLDLKEAEKAKIICGTSPKKCKGKIRGIITESVNVIAGEVINTLNFCEEHLGIDTQDTKIILCGGGAAMSDLDSEMAEVLKRDVSIANPLINTTKDIADINKADIDKYLSYTTAIGLALRHYALKKI